MKKIIIIGGGMAGLSAGCYAKMNGYDARIFEMHTLPGGLCTSWKREGYTFDGCIHTLHGTSPESPSYKIWQELGALKDKKIYYTEMSVKVFLKDRIVHFYNDPNKLAKYLIEIAPEDSRIIDELANSMRIFYPLLDVPLTKPKELFTVFDTMKDIKSFAPLIRLFQKYGKMTVDEFTGRFKNPVLQQAIRSTVDSASMDSGSINGFMGIVLLLASKGCGFPEGGSLNFAKSIERRYTDLGGTIQYGARIKKILVENNKAVGVQLEDGTEAHADIVVSAADGYCTIFKMLDGRFLNNKIKRCYEKGSVTPSYVQVSMGVDMDLSGDADINSVFNIYGLERPIVIGGQQKHSIRVKNYSFDPTFAPKGKSALTVTFLSKSAYWEEIYADKERYREEKRNVEMAVVSRLEEVMPGIKGKIEVIDVATPMTYIRYTNNWKGSTMGFAKGALLNLPRTLPALKDFFMAGQWVGDMGLDGAAKSGRDIVELICTKDGKRFTTTAL